MSNEPVSDLRVVVESLVARSGLPASTDEIEALVAAAPAVDAAVRRLYAVPLDHETEPAVALTHPADTAGEGR